MLQAIVGVFVACCGVVWGGKAARSVTIDIVQDYGFTQHGLEKAIADATAAVEQDPDALVTLFVEAGTHELRETGIPFDLSGIKPTGGRLELAGAGMDATTVVFDGFTFPTVQARPAWRLTIRDLTFSRSTFTTTQGTMVSQNASWVVLDIPAGFPTPQAIYDPQSPQGRFLRAYSNSATDPHLLVDPANNGTVWPPTSNLQVPWQHAVQVSDRRWALAMKGGHTSPPAFPSGALLGVKSKHQENVFFVDGGDDLRFERVRWRRHSRGVVRGGLSNILVDSCVVEREPAIEGQAPALATPGGGPQLGQPNDPPIDNVTVLNHTAVGTGDDSIALFRVRSGLVAHSRVRDSFARGILLCGSPDVVLLNNTLLRNPVWNDTACAM